MHLGHLLHANDAIAVDIVDAKQLAKDLFIRAAHHHCNRVRYQTIRVLAAAENQ